MSKDGDWLALNHFWTRYMCTNQIEFYSLYMALYMRTTIQDDKRWGKYWG